MIEEIMACLDGSEFAETILPYAAGISRSLGVELSFLRIVEEGEESSAAQQYLKRLAAPYRARRKVGTSKPHAASAILDELKARPHALAAMTTHGRTGMLEALLGSVAFSVVRGAARPILLYRPQAKSPVGNDTAETTITSVVVALDGEDFAEKILPHAAELAAGLKGRLEVVQALPPEAVNRHIPFELRRDVLESSYIQHKAHDLGRKYTIEVDWEVLHGQPADAIIRYVQGRREALLAMTTHARSGLERTIFGSVAAECLRRAGVPILIYWSKQ